MGYAASQYDRGSAEDGRYICESDGEDCQSCNVGYALTNITTEKYMCKSLFEECVKRNGSAIYKEGKDASCICPKGWLGNMTWNITAEKWDGACCGPEYIYDTETKLCEFVGLSFNQVVETGDDSSATYIGIIAAI